MPKLCNRCGGLGLVKEGLVDRPLADKEVDELKVDEKTGELPTGVMVCPACEGEPPRQSVLRGDDNGQA